MKRNIRSEQELSEGLWSLKKKSFFVETVKGLWRSRLAMVGLFLILLLIVVAIFADVIAPYGIDDQNLRDRFISPCREHIFGTDNLGRDIFSRIVYGSRISLMIGASVAFLSSFVGIVLGAFAGFYGGRTENLIMRFMDVLMSIPSTLLAISVLAALGAGLRNTIIAVAISSVPRYARVVRASIMSVKEEEYVEAAKCIGANDIRVVFSHILPNCLAPIIVQITLGVAQGIISAAALSFIGLGVQPPTPEWGTMLSMARPYLRDHAYMVLFPGLSIMATVFGLNLFGDGLRDALDPKLKR